MPRRPDGVRYLLASVVTGAAGLASGAALATTSASADIGVSAVYANNFALAASGQQSESGSVLDLNPVLQVSHDSAHLKGELNYLLHSFKYLDNGDFDTTYHDGDASLTWLAIPEWFDLSGDLGYHQRIVDPKRAATSDRLFNTGNLADAASASVTPELRHLFGELELDARYSYAWVNYKQNASEFAGSVDPQALDNSRNQTTHVSLGTRPEEEWSRFSWSTVYDNEKTDYDLALPYEYERASVLTAFGLNPGLSLLAEGGQESDLVKSTIDGGLDTGFWRAGFRYAPSPKTTLQVMGGHRFFGDTYFFRLHHVRKVLDLSLSYSEEPTTEGRQILRRTGPEGTLTPPPPGIDITRSTSAPFINKEFEATARLNGRLTSIYVRATSDERQYLTALSESDSVRAIAAGVERRIGPKMTLVIGGDGSRTRFHDGSSGTEKQFSAILRRQMTRTFRAMLVGRHIERTGTGVDNYKAWSVSLELRKSFGRAGALQNYADPLQP